MVSEDIIKEAAKLQTLDPGMSTLCGPAMRAAIMERAKELGLEGELKRDTADPDFLGVWVIDGNFSSSGKLSVTTNVDGRLDAAIPVHEFLRLLENTKPPVKELTTEEKLAEAVRLLNNLANGWTSLRNESQKEARAFIKSIKP